MRELFIYWRTGAEEAAAAERALEVWQRDLRAAYPGLRTALYRRAGEGGPSVTLMEIYADADGALDAALEQRIATEGEALLARWLQGPRKVEVFVRCASG